MLIVGDYPGRFAHTRLVGFSHSEKLPEMTTAESSLSVTEARELAVRAHADQRDRDGSFHIGHVARVAEAVPADESHQRVAWLHDVLEDSEMTASDLGARLTADELQALVLLTHHDLDEPYENYVARIVDAGGAAGRLARAIKEADVLDNLRRCARDHDPAIAQYGRALAALWAAQQT
jgi:hypothetical protein